MKEQTIEHEFHGKVNLRWLRNIFSTIFATFNSWRQ